MKIDYTPDPRGRSYQFGRRLGRVQFVGFWVTVLAAIAKGFGVLAAPWWLVLLPFLVPLALAVCVFALLGLIVALLAGGRK